MTKPVITTYADLMAEKARLKENLKQHKANINESFEGLKETLHPLTDAAKTAKAIFTADISSPFVAMGVSKVTDLVLRRFLLARTGWLTKLVAPVLVNKMATYLITHKASDKIAAGLRVVAEKLRKQ